MNNQLDRIESKLDRLLGENPKATEEQGLDDNDYIEASQNVVDELDQLGFKWFDEDRIRLPRIGGHENGSLLNGHFWGEEHIYRHDFLDRARVTAKRLGLVPKEAPKPTTIKGWLETLPEPYRTQALGVMLPGEADRDCSTLSSAIGKMCMWDLTPQGDSYWNAVCRWANNPTNNPLPEPWVAPTPEEIKLSKLVFGAKVCTPHGDGMYHCCSNIGFGYDHWVVFSNGERSNYGIDQITPL